MSGPKAAAARRSEAVFEAAWSEGRAMSPEGASEYALFEEAEHEPPALVAVLDRQPPAVESAESLTARERGFALLAAKGLTNCRIARELSISEHTAANHVRKILKKLGVRSRAQITPSPERQP